MPQALADQGRIPEPDGVTEEHHLWKCSPGLGTGQGLSMRRGGCSGRSCPRQNEQSLPKDGHQQQEPSFHGAQNSKIDPWPKRKLLSGGGESADGDGPPPQIILPK